MFTFLRSASLPPLLWLLALPVALQAQKAALTGVVVEAATGRPIPFATIEIPSRQLGVQATEAGTFTLEMPSPLTATDSLRVASLGFAPRGLAVPGALPCKLELAALAVPLAEVVVRASNKPLIRLGPDQKGERYGFGDGKVRATSSQGWQVARQFLGGPAGYIKAVRFYVKPNGRCDKKSMQAPFRVRLYTADGPAGSPGTDLLMTSLLTAASKPGWHEVDLSAFQLRVPEAGFFVGMEWLFTNADYGCEYTATMQATNQKETQYVYGQLLGGYLDDSPRLTWNLKTGRPWKQFMTTMVQVANNAGHQNAAIQAVIQPD